MLSEIRQSVSSILFERVSSPFYGAFITSWAIWNWKIIYVTLFLSSSDINVNKIDWIVENNSNANVLLTYPLLSAAALLTLAPFITNGAYWLHVIFLKWRVDKKHVVEMKTLLTMEQSIELRKQLHESAKKIESLLESKNLEVRQLSAQISELKKQSLEGRVVPTASTTNDLSTVSSLVETLEFNRKLRDTFDAVVAYSQTGAAGLTRLDGISTQSLAFLEANHLISNKGAGKYAVTDLGHAVLKKLLDDEF